MVELKPPHRPRSAVITTSSCTWSLPVPDNSFGALSELPTEAANPPRTAFIRSA